MNSSSVVLAILVLPSFLAAQVNKAAPVNATSSYSSGGSCPADKVKITSFTAAPTNPAPGQNVALKVTLKNLCSGVTLNIPFKVMRYGTQIGGGTSTLAGGASATAQVNWQAVAGEHPFDAFLDPNVVLGESNADRVNNAQTVAVHVIPLVTRVLQHTAGGFAPTHIVESVLCAAGTATIAQMAGFISGIASGDVAAGEARGTKFAVSGVLPCKMDTLAEAHAGLQLKNGWRVKSVNVSTAGSGGSWSWLTQPSAGSTTPYLKIRITANAGTTNYTLTANVTIEGPEGTSPF